MRTLAERYRLEEVIGRGGMGTVYRATDQVLQRTVAVKVLSAALAEGDPSYVERFEREARVAASLTHPGIVTVYDTGVDGEERFIAMEYVDGESLAEIIRREAPLDPDRAAGIAAQIADALDVAHRAGLVHRDVKPGNVMIARAGALKVLDFGIARAADALPITQTGSVLGAMPYMAPEQAVGEPVDARSDIYSLGCVLYEMLTAEPPFRDVIAAVYQQQSQAGPRSPREANPEVGRDMNALVLQMLAGAPAERPQSAAEVRDRLRGAPAPQAGAARAGPGADEEGTAATRILGGGGRAAGPPPLGSARGRRGEAWLRFAGGLLAIALVALIAVLALASGSSNRTSSTSSTAGPASSTSTTSSATSPSHSTTQNQPAQTSTRTTPTRTVTVTTTTPTPSTGGPGSGAAPPGQGGTPPGHAKNHKSGDGGGG